MCVVKNRIFKSYFTERKQETSEHMAAFAKRCAALAALRAGWPALRAVYCAWRVVTAFTALVTLAALESGQSNLTASLSLS